MSKLLERNLSNENHIDAINERGFTVLANLLNAERVTSVKAGLEPWLQQQLMGRNNFEGTRSERVYALLAKLPELAVIVEHPAILTLADHFLAPNYLLSANLAINVHPGETPQPFHADHASVPNCRSSGSTEVCRASVRLRTHWNSRAAGARCPGRAPTPAVYASGFDALRRLAD